MVVENLTGVGRIGKTRCWTLGTFPNIKGRAGSKSSLLAVVNR